MQAKTKRSLGIIKDKTDILLQSKKEIKDKSTRFQKKDADQNQKTKNQLFNEKTVQSVSLLPISHSTPTSDPMIELKSHNPKWFTAYESTLFHLKELEDIRVNLNNLEIKRIKDQFGDMSKLDMHITELTAKASERLRECEKNLNLIKNDKHDVNSKIDKKVQDNIVKSLAVQIQEATNKFRKQQKTYFENMKKLNEGGGSGKFLMLSQEKMSEMKDDYMDEMMTGMEMLEDIAKERDEEINKLVETINELTRLFKQMNEIVLEQGTILDRIDFNISQTLDNTVAAKKQLIEAERIQKSGRARSCTFILIILIIVFGVILVLKYTDRR